MSGNAVYMYIYICGSERRLYYALYDELRRGMLAGDSGQSGRAGGQSAGHVV